MEMKFWFGGRKGGGVGVGRLNPHNLPESIPCYKVCKGLYYFHVYPEYRTP